MKALFLLWVGLYSASSFATGACSAWIPNSNGVGGHWNHQGINMQFKHCPGSCLGQDQTTCSEYINPWDNCGAPKYLGAIDCTNAQGDTSGLCSCPDYGTSWFSNLTQENKDACCVTTPSVTASCSNWNGTTYATKHYGLYRSNKPTRSSLIHACVSDEYIDSSESISTFLTIDSTSSGGGSYPAGCSSTAPLMHVGDCDNYPFSNDPNSFFQKLLPQNKTICCQTSAPTCANWSGTSWITPAYANDFTEVNCTGSNGGAAIMGCQNSAGVCFSTCPISCANYGTTAFNAYTQAKKDKCCTLSSSNPVNPPVNPPVNLDPSTCGGSPLGIVQPDGVCNDSYASSTSCTSGNCEANATLGPFHQDQFDSNCGSGYRCMGMGSSTNPNLGTGYCKPCDLLSHTTSTQLSFTFAPSNYGFGNVDVNQLSSPKTIIIKNTGTKNASGCIVTLTDPVNYTLSFVSSGNCGSINASATCSVILKAKPSAVINTNTRIKINCTSAN